MRRGRFWTSLPQPSLDKVQARLRWLRAARPEQITPRTNSAWSTWLILAGRGWGKTRTGAEDVADYGMWNPGVRIAVVAPTFGDARDTCIEGVSGLLSLLPQSAVDAWNRSIGELKLENGTIYRCFAATEPDRLRGPQFHRAWCDEVAAWKYATETWDMLQFGLRLGTNPQVVATTTPRPIPLVRELVDDPATVLTRGSTYDNAENLAASFLRRLRQKYEGTRLGRQELSAEILDDTPGALWTRDLIEVNRLRPRIDGEDISYPTLPDMVRIVVAIDPQGKKGGEDGTSETGIVVAGKGEDDEFYVLADLSIDETPNEWARIAVAGYRDWSADRIVGEVNQGGDMVAAVIRTVDPDVSFREVRATKGKYLRAEPVSALYEQGRVHHVGAFPVLEDQMCTFVPSAKTSPDRLDALVWAITSLMEDIETPDLGAPRQVGAGKRERI